MPLNHLWTAKSAQFFRPNPKKRLTPTNLRELVKTVGRGRVGQFQERRIREVVRVDDQIASVTYACYRLSDEPPFLRGSSLREEKYAYFLIVEAPETIALFSRNAEGVLDGLLPFVLPWGYEHLGGIFIDDTAAYERISLRAMSLGGNVVRRRSLEADNLAVSMAVAGVHRSIPNNFRTRGAAGTHTITPKNARISRRDSRADIGGLVRWVVETGQTLSAAAPNYARSFLAEFCRAMPIADLPVGVTPNAIMFDFSQLRSKWEEAPTEYEFALARSMRSESQRILNDKQVAHLFDFATQVFSISDNGIASPTRPSRMVAKVRTNVNSITVRGGLMDRIRVTAGGHTRHLSTYANNEGNFVITFTNPQFGYSEGQLFQDSNLLGSIDRLLDLFEGFPQLATVTDEKDFRGGEFGENGIFRFVEDVVDAGESLVCDDLGDEWADFIAVDLRGGTPRLAFIHCKHSAVSTSASGLQVPIAQAVKNLSRMVRPSSDFETKVDRKWAGQYSGTVPRIRRGGDATAIKAAFSNAIGHHNTERVVVLVLSGVSRTSLATEFGELRAANARPHVTQLLWLLTSLVAACREHGASVRILCQP